MQNEDEKPDKTTDFGVFYPLGHIVVAFPKYEDALRAQRDLLAGGYDLADCVVRKSEEVAAAAAANLSENTGWLARLGKSDEAVQAHLNAAKQGAAFMLIYAPGDTDAERAMNVVRRVPFELAHRYRRFAIEDLKA